MDRRTFVSGSLAVSLATALGAGTAAASTGRGGGNPGTMKTTSTNTTSVSASTTGESVVRAVIPEHPRLMLRDFEAVRGLVASDSRAAGWYAKVKADADAILDRPVSEYEIPDGLRLLATSREVLRRTYSLALTYALEGDRTYADRLWAEMAAVADFPDWNSQRHFLDTAEMTHAVAIAYDWLFHDWNDEQRATMRTAMREFGLKPGLEVYGRGNGWHTGVNNWNIVCNSGLALGALVLAQDEPEISARVLDEALASVPIAIAEYAPHGGYPEGLGSYWGYATKYLVPLVESLTTATGDDRGLADSEGLAETGLFPIHLTGPTGENFDYYDAGGGSPRPPEMFWLARRYDTPVYGWWGGLGADQGSIGWLQSPLALLWYDPDLVQTPLEADLPLDRYFGTCEVVTMRSGWQDEFAAFTGFKGGANSTGHADLDLGDFVYEARGVRWAVELGADDYNMPGYFNGGPGGQRWTYYRKRAEGQNTLVVDPGKGEDQNVRAVGTIVARESGPTAAYAVADLSAAHPRLTSWRRGVRQFDARQQIVVQDEFAADAPVEVWWFLHTSASITIADDGRSATLEQNGQRVLARLSAPADATFYDAAAKPLWRAPDPDAQADITGIRKLAIRLRDLTTGVVSVQLSPLGPGEPAPDPEPVTAMAEWTTGPAAVARLARLTVDGEDVPSFAPANLVYTVRPRSDTVPRITAEPAHERGKAIVHPPSSVPGVATIDVTEPGRARARYRVVLQRESGPGFFPRPIVASSDDGNVPENTMDGDLWTRWSAEGDGEWIGFDMGADGPVSGVAIAWYQGADRTSRFDVEVAAADDQSWRQVFSGTSSGTTTDPETYSFDEVTARYLRIVGHGNSVNDWNSITEVTIPGRTVELPPTPPHLARVTIDVPGTVPVGGTATIQVTGTMSDGSAADLSDAEVSFDTDDAQVASVSDDGTMNAVAEGEVTVAAIVVTRDHRLEYDRALVRIDDPNTVRVPAAADTYVNDGSQAGNNYGNATTLLVKSVSQADSGYTRQTYLRFAPQSTTRAIESVTLYLHANVADSEGTEIDLDVHRLAGTFDERTVTWETRPAVGEKIGSTHVVDTPQWCAVDLTSAVRDTVAAGRPIDLAVVQNPPAGRNGLATQIRSRESGQGPYLHVRLVAE